MAGGTLRDIARTRMAQPREAMIAGPPLTAAGMLRVSLDQHRGAVLAVPWMPRPDEEPSAGDAALLVESDGGSWWCVAWWPQ